MEEEKIIKEQKETIKNHYLIIFISTPIFIGLFYSIYFFSIIKFLIFTILSILISYYLISTLKNEKRKKEIYTGLILTFIFSYSLINLYKGEDFLYQIHIYYISLSIYHYAEYLSVLFYHFDNCSWHSFLIDQSKQWIYTTSFSFLEYYIENFFFHKFKSFILFTIIGIICLIIGQYFRIAALFTGKVSFTHLISYKKKKEHVLVTHGIYSISRHPSYFGFFIWSIGTQILCFNPICIICYPIALFIFFKDRILDEEILLIQFFGNEYIKYKRKVPILIPFINLSENDEKKSLEIYKRNKEIEEKFPNMIQDKKKEESSDEED
jgi:protein-S-isoprenylcysteine O-methyltransferase